MLRGINHITFAVKDLARSFSFYRDVLGFKPLLKWPAGAYFLVGNDWFCLSTDHTTRSGPLPEYTHIAFSVTPDEFPVMCERIISSGATIFKSNISEGESLYFLDPDGHKLEIHATDWQARLNYFRDNPKPGMEFFPV